MPASLVTVNPRCFWASNRFPALPERNVRYLFSSFFFTKEVKQDDSGTASGLLLHWAEGWPGQKGELPSFVLTRCRNGDGVCPPLLSQAREGAWQQVTQPCVFKPWSREMRRVSRTTGCSGYVTLHATAMMRGRGIPLWVMTHTAIAVECRVCAAMSLKSGCGELPQGERRFFHVGVWTCRLGSMSLRGGKVVVSVTCPLPRGQYWVTTADWQHAFMGVLTGEDM